MWRPAWLEFTEHFSERSHPFVSMKSRIALASLSVLSLVACQAAFGDFTIDTTHLVPSCTPGEQRCQTSALQRCGSDGATWELIEQCRNGALCHEDQPQCEAPTCTTSRGFRCRANTQQQCRENLRGWDDITQCPSSGSCDPDRGCLPSPCTTGDTRCNDVVPETCNNGVWVGQAACETRVLCNAQHTCTPPTCGVGERQCQGNALRICNADRNGWQDFQTCDSQSVCNPTTKHCDPAP